MSAFPERLRVVSFVEREVDLLLLLWLPKALSSTPFLQLYYGNTLELFPKFGIVIEIILIMLVVLILAGFLVLVLLVLGSIVLSYDSVEIVLVMFATLIFVGFLVLLAA